MGGSGRFVCSSSAMMSDDQFSQSSEARGNIEVQEIARRRVLKINAHATGRSGHSSCASYHSHPDQD
jgi:hypothetical protein